MVSGKRERIPAAAAGGGGGGGGAHERQSRFKGVRMRSWGKWVSEIRLPNTRTRLWLGSFATAQQAARAFDVAVVCLRGRSATLNFPDSPPAHAPLGLTLRRIQELAAAAAASDAPSAAPSQSTNRSLASRSRSPPPASPSSTQSEPAFFLHSRQQPLATQSESAAHCPQSEPASAACSSPSYSCCDPLEAATLSDSCSSTWQRAEELQALAWMQEEELRLEAQWDELLWSSSLSSSLALEPHLLTFPLLPPQDNMREDEDCLWSL